MITWHLPCFRSQLKFIFADWTVWIGAKMPLCYLNSGHRINWWPGCWGGASLIISRKLFKQFFKSRAYKVIAKITPCKGNTGRPRKESFELTISWQPKRNLATKDQQRAKTWITFRNWTWSRSNIMIMASLPHKGWESFHEPKPIVMIIITFHSKKIQWADVMHITKFLDKSSTAVGASCISPSQSNWPPASVTPVGISAAWHPSASLLSPLCKGSQHKTHLSSPTSLKL